MHLASITADPLWRWLAAFWTALGQNKESIEAGGTVITALAILLGSAWAYFKFAKGRVFVTRLEPTIEGRIIRGADHHFVVVKIAIKNVGLAKADLDQFKSTIVVHSYSSKTYLPEFHNAFLDYLGTIYALTNHDWIEPGECIVEERLLALPPDPVLALKLHLRLVQGRVPRPLPGVVWNAFGIVTPDQQPHVPSQTGPKRTAKSRREALDE